VTDVLIDHKDISSKSYMKPFIDPSDYFNDSDGFDSFKFEKITNDKN
jgi:hypothetical protein